MIVGIPGNSAGSCGKSSRKSANLRKTAARNEGIGLNPWIFNGFLCSDLLRRGTLQ
jgi:hypothetical protein